MIKELSYKEYLKATSTPTVTRVHCFQLGGTLAALMPAPLGGYFIVFSRLLYPDCVFVPVRCEEHEFTSEEEAVNRVKATLKERYESPQYRKELGGFKFASSILQASDGFLSIIHATHFVDPSDECDLLNDTPPCIFSDEILVVSEATFSSETAARAFGTQMLDKILHAVNSGAVEGTNCGYIARG